MGLRSGALGAPLPDKEVLLSLAKDLPAVWNSPSTDMRLKQRIVRILIQEIIPQTQISDRQHAMFSEG
jgi:hypothetical protein